MCFEFQFHYDGLECNEFQFHHDAFVCSVLCISVSALTDLVQLVARITMAAAATSTLLANGTNTTTVVAGANGTNTTTAMATSSIGTTIAEANGAVAGANGISDSIGATVAEANGAVAEANGISDTSIGTTVAEANGISGASSIGTTVAEANGAVLSYWWGIEPWATRQPKTPRLHKPEWLAPTRSRRQKFHRATISGSDAAPSFKSATSSPASTPPDSDVPSS